jgi:hypothetical protein
MIGQKTTLRGSFIQTLKDFTLRRDPSSLKMKTFMSLPEEIIIIILISGESMPTHCKGYRYPRLAEMVP